MNNEDGNNQDGTFATITAIISLFCITILIIASIYSRQVHSSHPCILIENNAFHEFDDYIIDDSGNFRGVDGKLIYVLSPPYSFIPFSMEDIKNERDKMQIDSILSPHSNK